MHVHVHVYVHVNVSKHSRARVCVYTCVRVVCVFCCLCNPTQSGPNADPIATRAIATPFNHKQGTTSTAAIQGDPPTQYQGEEPTQSKPPPLFVS